MNRVGIGHVWQQNLAALQYCLGSLQRQAFLVGLVTSPVGQGPACTTGKQVIFFTETFVSIIDSTIIDFSPFET